MRFLILTTDSKAPRWRSLPYKLSKIREALGPNWTVEIEYVKTDPVVNTKGRLDHKYITKLFDPYHKKGFDVIGLHMNLKHQRQLGISPSLRGANPITTNKFGDFYFWSDEHTKRGGRLSRFIQTCLHEFCHEYFQRAKLPDTTHEYHDKHNDITPLVKSFDWSKFSLT